MKRFLVAVEGMTIEQEHKFLDYIRSNEWGWWHRVNNFWLLLDASDTATAIEIRDFLLDMELGGKTVLVMPLDDHNAWAGLAATSNVKQTFEWLHKDWKESD